MLRPQDHASGDKKTTLRFKRQGEEFALLLRERKEKKKPNGRQRENESPEFHAQVN